MFFNSPFSSSKANALIELLELETGAQVIDVGCGTGEFLIRIVERFSAHGIGVDVNGPSLVCAQASASERVPGSRIELVASSILDYAATPESFDCAICLGSTHAYALDEPAYPEALNGLANLVRPGGKLLIGESYWVRDPPKDYQDFVGEPSGTYRTHLENVELAVERGLIPHHVTTSSLDDWDDFEWRHNIRKEEEAASKAGDPEAE